MPWFKILPDVPVSDVRSILIERYEMDEYAFCHGGSRWQIMHMTEYELSWHEEKHIELDLTRLQQIRNRWWPSGQSPVGAAPLDIPDLLSRYFTCYLAGVPGL